jgi:hypothetical protein
VWSGVYSGGAGTFKSVAVDLLLELRVAYATLLSASSCRNQLINVFELVKIWSTILRSPFGELRMASQASDAHSTWSRTIRCASADPFAIQI